MSRTWPAVSNKYDSFSYCFKISLASSDKFFLTSAAKIIDHESISYLPASGLRIIKGSFNDSGSDCIILGGIFELGAINNFIDMRDALIEISIFSKNAMNPYVTYSCTQYIKYDLNFEIYMQPLSIRYDQSIINNFSKTCRAKFGDAKCRADKNLYSHEYQILNLTNKTIEVADVKQENGYFVEGTARIVGSQFEAKILNSNGSTFHIDRVISNDLKNNTRVILIAGCDKEFITCCNKFNNAVNFRGEPYIPKSNFLEVD
ncbi:MAG: DUF2163 domain-containing protein [Janthinobacterium lividum]